MGNYKCLTLVNKDSGGEFCRRAAGDVVEGVRLGGTLRVRRPGGLVAERPDYGSKQQRCRGTVSGRATTTPVSADHCVKLPRPAFVGSLRINNRGKAAADTPPDLGSSNKMALSPHI